METFCAEIVSHYHHTEYCDKKNVLYLAALRREATNLLVDVATTDDERIKDVEDMQTEMGERFFSCSRFQYIVFKALLQERLPVLHFVKL